MAVFIVEYVDNRTEEVEADSFDETGHEGRWLQFFSKQKGIVLAVRTTDLFSIRQK
jgi:hypothetical protein